MTAFASVQDLARVLGAGHITGRPLLVHPESVPHLFIELRGTRWRTATSWVRIFRLGRRVLPRTAMSDDATCRNVPLFLMTHKLLLEIWARDGGSIDCFKGEVPFHVCFFSRLIPGHRE